MIQGICYSPVPIGESVNVGAKGDYFTLDYAYIWQRDLPLIKAMGANTIRIYGWNNHVDHTEFLDACHSIGLKVLITFYLGDAWQSPVSLPEQRAAIIQLFVEQVARYKDHPAILMWSFGNEVDFPLRLLPCNSRCSLTLFSLPTVERFMESLSHSAQRCIQLLVDRLVCQLSRYEQRLPMEIDMRVLSLVQLHQRGC